MLALERALVRAYDTVPGRLGRELGARASALEARLRDAGARRRATSHRGGDPVEAALALERRCMGATLAAIGLVRTADHRDARRRRDEGLRPARRDPPRPARPRPARDRVPGRPPGMTGSDPSLHSAALRGQTPGVSRRGVLLAAAGAVLARPAARAGGPADGGPRRRRAHRPLPSRVRRGRRLPGRGRAAVRAPGRQLRGARGGAALAAGLGRAAAAREAGPEELDPAAARVADGGGRTAAHRARGAARGRPRGRDRRRLRPRRRSGRWRRSWPATPSTSSRCTATRCGRWRIGRANSSKTTLWRYSQSDPSC